MSLKHFGGLGIGFAAYLTLTGASALHPAAMPQHGTSVILAQAKTDPLGAHAAIEAAREMLSELDATITALDEDARQLGGEAQARADAAVAELRKTRDAYLEQIETAVADIRQGAEERAEQMSAVLDERRDEAERYIDGYLATVNKELSIRTTVFKARWSAAQRHWQQMIAELQESVASLSPEHREVLDKRIADLRAKINDRLAELQQAGGDGWSAMRDRLTTAREDIQQTYEAVVEAIQDATG